MKQQSSDQFSSDLNTLAKIVKRSFAGFELLISQLNSSTEANSWIQKISEEIYFLLAVVKKYKQADCLAHIEVIEQFQQKLKLTVMQIKSKYESTPYLKDIRILCQQIDLSLKIYDKSEHFLSFVNKFYGILHHQLRVFKIKIDLNQQNQQSPSFYQFKRAYSLSQNPCKYSKKQQQSGKMLNIFGLDLDNNFIKSNLLLGQRNQVDWIEAQLEKNKLAAKNILQFTKQYFLYKQKLKDKKKYVLCPKIQNKQQLRIKTSVHQKLYRNMPIERMHRDSIRQKENVQEEGPKLIYKMSNLYVSGNEFNIYCQSAKNRLRKANKDNKKNSLLYRINPGSLTSKHSHQYSHQISNFLF